MTSLHEPVMELVRASLNPLVPPARSRGDDPACQVVIRAADADLKAGGLDHVNRLAIGTGVAAAGLTSWLAQERHLEPEAVVGQLEQSVAENGGGPLSPVVGMIKMLLTGPPGMAQVADFMVTQFHEDEEKYYDLVVDLGRYTASCIGMLNALNISSQDDTLDNLDAMLQEFFTA
ncbi:hypothetical protein ACFVW9_35995 [Streptomyces sp. NPDC058217]|uniref:hypothetical protein n=1 Tax=Streptomyces sp. NPDC058217 TaxID=3346384 RepID=UPI0036E1D02C